MLSSSAIIKREGAGGTMERRVGKTKNIVEFGVCRCIRYPINRTRDWLLLKSMDRLREVTCTVQTPDMRPA